MRHPDQYLEPNTRLLHYVILHYLALVLQYLSDLTHVYTPARSLCSSSDTHIVSTPNVKFLATYTQTSTRI